GITRNNDNLMIFDGLNDLVLAVGDGELCRVVELHGNGGFCVQLLFLGNVSGCHFTRFLGRMQKGAWVGRKKDQGMLE
ncbi:MAG: hypothetical protein D3907_04095, partial [Candidatus Electrothrix sp. AUS3]|nr:hypothetical protein [Candidatus Electrothrix gigas]